MLTGYFELFDLDASYAGIYHALLQHGPNSAGQLAKILNTARPTLYDQLKKLGDLGLVKQSLQGKVKIFHAAPPETISELLTQRQAILQQKQLQLQNDLPLLIQSFQQRAATPRFEFFEGAAGVKQVLMDMLNYRDMETRSFWPIAEMIKLLSAEFFDWHNRQRIQNKLSVKAIWPHSYLINIAQHPYLGGGKSFHREIRVAPKMTDTGMGYWIYGNKIAFLSSTREHYGFIIDSPDMAELMTVQHELIWKLSDRLPVNPDDVKGFLASLAA